jgi:hypothetical protein
MRRRFDSFSSNQRDAFSTNEGNPLTNSLFSRNVALENAGAGL